MNRRGFLRAMVGGIAVAAAERSFPFRVFSFPKEITLAPVEVISPWFSVPHSPFIALQLEKYAQYIPDLIERDKSLFERLHAIS